MAFGARTSLKTTFFSKDLLEEHGNNLAPKLLTSDWLSSLIIFPHLLGMFVPMVCTCEQIVLTRDENIGPKSVLSVLSSFPSRGEIVFQNMLKGTLPQT